MPPLLLVRHAQAGLRGSGPSDLDRPLDGRGLAQASALPALLGPLLTPAGDRAVDIRSSPARRCIQTVMPLAAAFGTEPIVDEALLEGCDVGVLQERIAMLDRPTVWSSHGDVIPELLTMLARRGLDIGPRPTCRKGSTWIIEIVDGRAAAARSLPPPA
jgi:broad specificity phosphatase PhoE